MAEHNSQEPKIAHSITSASDGHPDGLDLDDVQLKRAASGKANSQLRRFTAPVSARPGHGEDEGGTESDREKKKGRAWRLFGAKKSETVADSHDGEGEDSVDKTGAAQQASNKTAFFSGELRLSFRRPANGSRDSSKQNSRVPSAQVSRQSSGVASQLQALHDISQAAGKKDQAANGASGMVNSASTSVGMPPTVDPMSLMSPTSGEGLPDRAFPPGVARWQQANTIAKAKAASPGGPGPRKPINTERGEDPYKVPAVTSQDVIPIPALPRIRTNAKNAIKPVEKSSIPVVSVAAAMAKSGSTKAAAPGGRDPPIAAIAAGVAIAAPPVDVSSVIPPGARVNSLGERFGLSGAGKSGDLSTGGIARNKAKSGEQGRSKSGKLGKSGELSKSGKKSGSKRLDASKSQSFMTGGKKAGSNGGNRSGSLRACFYPMSPTAESPDAVDNELRRMTAQLKQRQEEELKQREARKKAQAAAAAARGEVVDECDSARVSECSSVDSEGLPKAKTLMEAVVLRRTKLRKSKVPEDEEGVGGGIREEDEVSTTHEAVAPVNEDREGRGERLGKDGRRDS